MSRTREEFIAIMTAEGMPLDAVRKIMRNAATIQRLAVKACNRELTLKEEARNRMAQVRIIGLAQTYDSVPVFNGDPRGACVKLQVPSGNTNDWGNTGICVPTPRY